MAYDRFDPRDERSRWSDDCRADRPRSMSGDWRGDRGGRDNPDDRGFFDRASDEVASWFGDDEAERRRREDRLREEREFRSARPGSYDRDWNDNRGVLARGGSSADE